MRPCVKASVCQSFWRVEVGVRVGVGVSSSNSSRSSSSRRRSRSRRSRRSRSRSRRSRSRSRSRRSRRRCRRRRSSSSSNSSSRREGEGGGGGEGGWGKGGWTPFRRSKDVRGENKGTSTSQSSTRQEQTGRRISTCFVLIMSCDSGGTQSCWNWRIWRVSAALSLGDRASGVPCLINIVWLSLSLSPSLPLYKIFNYIYIFM